MANLASGTHEHLWMFLMMRTTILRLWKIEKGESITVFRCTGQRLPSHPYPASSSTLLMLSVYVAFSMVCSVCMFM